MCLLGRRSSTESHLSPSSSDLLGLMSIFTNTHRWVLSDGAPSIWQRLRKDGGAVDILGLLGAEAVELGVRYSRAPVPNPFAGPTLGLREGVFLFLLFVPGARSPLLPLRLLHYLLAVRPPMVMPGLHGKRALQAPSNHSQSQDWSACGEHYRSWLTGRQWI